MTPVDGEGLARDGAGQARGRHVDTEGGDATDDRAGGELGGGCGHGSESRGDLIDHLGHAGHEAGQRRKERGEPFEGEREQGADDGADEVGEESLGVVLGPLLGDALDVVAVRVDGLADLPRGVGGVVHDDRHVVAPRVGGGAAGGPGPAELGDTVVQLELPVVERVPELDPLVAQVVNGV
ncbi:hypothetical protein [Actinoallomurus bryophytorum]|uniref:hypothetical protein n=1 Tax=Actinoallomurus bryophytorum TaxID=1490222 RepID=UPI00114E5028|nr:hypothetical protein [Actinoallomurus bryophytorum]